MISPEVAKDRSCFHILSIPKLILSFSSLCCTSLGCWCTQSDCNSATNLAATEHAAMINAAGVVSSSVNGSNWDCLTFWRRMRQLGAQMSRWRVSSLANCSDWVNSRVCRNLSIRQRSWCGRSSAGLKKQKRTRLALISTRSPVWTEVCTKQAIPCKLGLTAICCAVQCV